LDTENVMLNNIKYL